MKRSSDYSKHQMLAAAVLGLLFLLGAAACSDDSDENGNQDATVGSDGGPPYDANLLPVDGSAISDGDTGATVSGIVIDADTGDPEQGATVSLVGFDPAITTTTDSQGLYALQGPSGAQMTLRAENEDSYPMQMRIRLTAAGLQGADLPLVANSYADQLVSTAGLPAQDAQKGIVVVQFEDPQGGEAPTLDAANDGSFAIDDSNTPVQSDSVIAGGGDIVVFVNVEPGYIALDLSGASGCQQAFAQVADHQVDAGMMTFIPVECASN